MKSQRDRLLSWFKKRKAITTLCAISELGILRCSERVRELIAEGHKIDRQRVAVSNRFGEECRVARYVYRGMA